MRTRLVAYENSATLLFRIMSQSEITSRVTQQICARLPPGQMLPSGFESTLSRTINDFYEEVSSQAVDEHGDSVLLDAVEATMLRQRDVEMEVTRPPDGGGEASSSRANAQYLL
eukprot:3763371-Amphidinium_carterae.1